MATFRQVNVNGLADGSQPGQARLRTLSRMQPASTDAARTMRSRLGRAGDEAASRRYLETYLEDAGSETLLALTAPDRPELVPDMQIQNTATTPQLEANSVAYQQTAHAIPVFGGRLVVDVDSADKTLVAINGKVAPLDIADCKTRASGGMGLTRRLGGTSAAATPASPASPPVLTLSAEGRK